MKEKFQQKKVKSLQRIMDFFFFETSALTGKGVKEAFDTLIQMIFEKNQNSN